MNSWLVPCIICGAAVWTVALWNTNGVDAARLRQSFPTVPGETYALQVGGAQVGTNAADQGTGNYLPYVVYIGMRAGTSLPASMVLNELVTRFGATPDTSLIVGTEQAVNSKTYAYG